MNILGVFGVVVVTGKNLFKKAKNIKTLWKGGNKGRAVISTTSVLVTTGASAIMLYNPRILMRLVLRPLLIMMDYMPIPSIVIVGIEFVLM